MRRRAEDFNVITQVQRLTLQDAQADLRWPPQAAKLSAPLPDQPVVLYLYSDRRRPGDFASHFEAWGRLHAVSSNALLIDVALSADHDMRYTAHVSRFADWIREGKVFGILMAPCCESWSSARALEGTPRVLHLPETP